MAELDPIANLPRSDRLGIVAQFREGKSVPDLADGWRMPEEWIEAVIREAVKPDA